MMETEIVQACVEAQVWANMWITIVAIVVGAAALCVLFRML